MDIMGRLFRPPDGCCRFIELQPVAPRAEGSPARRQETATLASAGIPKPQELLLGAAESARHAGEDERDSGADQHRLVVILIVSSRAVCEATFRANSTPRLVFPLVFHSGLRILNFARKWSQS